MAALNGTQLIADYLTPTIGQTSIIGISWAIGLVIIILTLLSITRDFGKWPRLILPVAVMWGVVGLNIGIAIYIVAIFIWIMDVMSINNLEKGIMALGRSRRQEKKMLQQSIQTAKMKELSGARLSKRDTILSSVFGKGMKGRKEAREQLKASRILDEKRKESISKRETKKKDKKLAEKIMDKYQKEQIRAEKSVGLAPLQKGTREVMKGKKVLAGLARAAEKSKKRKSVSQKLGSKVKGKRTAKKKSEYQKYLEEMSKRMKKKSY